MIKLATLEGGGSGTQGQLFGECQAHGTYQRSRGCWITRARAKGPMLNLNEVGWEAARCGSCGACWGGTC
jgi:hypothetical protein